MNKLQLKAVEIFERPWDEMAAETKELKLQYERLLNSSKRSERAQTIGFRDDLEKNGVRLFYTTNTNAQGGRSNGGGRGWYISGRTKPGIVESYLVLAD
jgi:hypothetical protein